MSDKVAAKVLISGNVQGVGFRYFTTDLARNYGVNGWVRNLATGDVEVEIEGDKSLVSGFLKELKAGPRYGRIGNFQIEWKPYEGKYDSFQVRF
jgi:acylphosphatase